MSRRYAHQPMNTQSHHQIGLLIFLETHRRILGGEFGRIPGPLKDDAFSMGGYCLDAHEIMPAGSTEFYSVGPGDDEWLACPTTFDRGVQEKL